MNLYLETTLTEIGAEVAALAEGGVLILFAAGSPPELAEVSVLHRADTPPSDMPPATGAKLELGSVSATVTAVGNAACGKMCERGHIVLSFNGADTADRPGEMCLSIVDPAALVAVLQPGARLKITS